MPAERHVDATTLDAVVVALTRSASASLEASHELLAHYVDTGDVTTQRAVNTLIEQAADTLRAMTDAFADISGELSATLVRAGMATEATTDDNALRTATFRAAEAEGRFAGPRPPRQR